jgi:hypothetical protein
MQHLDTPCRGDRGEIVNGAVSEECGTAHTAERREQREWCGSGGALFLLRMCGREARVIEWEKGGDEEKCHSCHCFISSMACINELTEFSCSSFKSLLTRSSFRSN